MGGGVESPQGVNIPGVAEEPREDETPGGPTAAQGGPGEDEQGRGGGDENSPTSLATRMQGADCGNHEPMGGQWTGEPLDTMEMAEEDGSAGPWPRKPDGAIGANGARYKHGALAPRKYDLLASEATEWGPANTGAAGSKDGDDALAHREGTETEDGGGKTPQRWLPAREYIE